MPARMKAAVMVLIALPLATLTLAQDKPRGEKLSDAELTRLFTPPAISTGYSKRSQNLYSNAYVLDGIVISVVNEPPGHAGQMQGKWRILDGSRCRTFPPILPMERCVDVYRLADGSYESWAPSTGTLRLTASFQVLRMPE